MNPRNIFAELKRRNVYKVAVAYAVVGWLLIQAASIILPTFEAPTWTMKVLITALTIGFPIAVVLAWAFEITPEGIVRAEDVAPNESITRKTGRKLVGITVTLAVIATGLFVFRMVGADRRAVRSNPREKENGRRSAASLPVADKSIAVLPFVNMSSDKENEYFVDGLTEEILNRLAQISALKVPGRTSSFAFKEKNSDLRQIGAALGVAHVLEGSVRKAGQHLRITAQLVRASDGYHLWSHAYDRELNDVFAIQEEIARAIADSLSVQLKLGGEGKSDQPTQDMAAYGDYLEARALITHRDSENLRRATKLLEATVERDPAFAKAWAALAQVRALGFYYLAVSKRESLEGGENAARHALSLDESLGTAHCVLANVLRDRFDWTGAETEYRRALELSPGEGETYNQYAQMLLKVGRFDIALENAKRACEMDPLAWVPPSIVSFVEMSRGDLVQGRVWLDRLEKLRGKIGGFALRLELIDALSRHDIKAARQALALARTSEAPEWASPENRKAIEVMDGALASANPRDESPVNLATEIEAINALGETDLTNELAAVAVFLKQPEAAFAVLNRALVSADGLDPTGIWAPPLRPLFHDRRFAEILRAFKMPDYWREAGWPQYCRSKGADDFECSAP